MMKYYQELELLPQDEVNLHFLWSKVFQQIHLGLVEMQDEQGRIPIGVSFPDYMDGKKLGGKLRLFANDETILSQFNATKWLSRLSDYVHCTGIRPVPEKILGYAVYQREQAKTGNERLARRYAKRHTMDYDTALMRYSGLTHKTLATPFIRLKSLSGDQMFCLWIKKTKVEALSGATFSSYGLSAVAGVPEF
ncbi:MAG: type I-F CRISPR-associated endoribonuclease Cas6/Csy4 [Methylococcaceae bacterium]